MDVQQNQLITGLRNGDKKVYEEIFDTYYEPLFNYCMSRIQNQEDAEEIVQDIFVKLWIKRNELNIAQSLRAYLYRMALNKIINYTEHHKVRRIHQAETLAMHSHLDNQVSVLQENEIQQIVFETVDRMPPKRRAVYELSRHEGLKYAEIAQQLDISIKTVEAHLSRALEQLRIALKDYLPILLTTITVLHGAF